MTDSGTLTKGDKSPVTVADFGVQAAVSRALLEGFPDDPLVGEEDASALREASNEGLKDRVLEHVRALIGDGDEASILAAIDRGTHEGGSRGRHWTLDPIDGTKGFLRGEQYAVALALIEEGEVKVGVLGCPSLPVDFSDSGAGTGCLFAAILGGGCTMMPLDDPSNVRTIQACETAAPEEAVFCESVESAHSSHGDSQKIGELLGVTQPPLRIDSQCKYAVLARGDVSVYLRLPTSDTYREKIWDHAAGSLVVTEAGATVSDVRGAPLDFGIGRKLEKNRGVIAASAGIHPRVLSAVREVLER